LIDKNIYAIFIPNNATATKAPSHKEKINKKLRQHLQTNFFTFSEKNNKTLHQFFFVSPGVFEP